MPSLLYKFKCRGLKQGDTHVFLEGELHAVTQDAAILSIEDAVYSIGYDYTQVGIELHCEVPHAQAS